MGSTNPGSHEAWVLEGLHLHFDVGGYWLWRASAALRLQPRRAPAGIADVVFWDVLPGHFAPADYDHLTHHRL